MVVETSVLALLISSSPFLLPSTGKNNLVLFNTLSVYVSLFCNLRQGGQMLRRSEAPCPQTFFHSSDPAVSGLEDPGTDLVNFISRSCSCQVWEWYLCRNPGESVGKLSYP